LPTPSNGDFALVLENVSKRYFLNPTRPWHVKDVVTRPKALFRQIIPREPFWAVRDVSLRVRRGEIVGIIGPNGSGKSTLLRMMVGISPPTAGRVSVNGRYAALLELGAGFHPQVSGRDNAYLNALFMGMSKAEARRLVPEIIEFSGLGAFAEQPMRTYSSGMYVRLGFSVAIHLQPEILVIDEVLAVGDTEFQQKCFNHFARLKEQKATIILVTHGLASLIDFADRVVQLERGQVVQDGDPVPVVQKYIMDRNAASPSARRSFRRALREQGLLADGVDDEEDEPPPSPAPTTASPAGLAQDQ
jgi:ABC-2 type transport system ATP-binding protein/lipopolysaccharide transport system ATP-binding protein